MFSTVVTIVGKGLDAAVEEKAVAAVMSVKAGGYLRQTVLKPGYAVDILLSKSEPGLVEALQEQFAGFGAFDVFVQKNDAFRKKKLLVADMDSTIVQDETLDELAGMFGLKESIAAITAQAMNGEIDFDDALRARVKLLRGMPEAELLKVAGRMRYSPGAETLLRASKALGIRTVLISGGFDVFTQSVALELGFDAHFGNTLGVEAGVLTGEVVSQVLNKAMKASLLMRELEQMGVGTEHALAVGDGANDIHMLQRAGAGVGYYAKPAVLEATPHQIRHSDLTALLYMQGYKEQDFLPQGL